ncbi:MAG: SH3 domain-containing protein [Oscillospiraceae bacterium]|nr:SH3 domain-containing protein [Oscillospiraceae bacterium]MBQ7130344.1 SH3 domain-containing protein [Oscillospiraceae bacterium]
MKKQILCFLLALIMVLGMIPNAAITANAFSQREASADAVANLMGSEVFYEKPQGTVIGYNTEITAEQAKNFANGITKEQAVDLLKDALKEIDEDINAYVKTNNMDLTKGQHDALAVHIYRNGSDNGLLAAARAGKTGNAIVEVFVDSRAHSYSSVEELKTTLDICLSEAAMYLYGFYGQNGGNNLGYARLDTNGDLKADDVVGYVIASGYNLKVQGTDTFLGWYVYNEKDSKFDAAAITKLDKDTNGKLIVAKQGEDNKNIAASYTINTKTLTNLNVYDGQLDDIIGTLKNDTNFKVSAESMVSGEKWIYGTGTNTSGKAITGWVCLGKLSDANAENAKPIASATVTASTLNIRAGATGDSEIVGKLKAGTSVKIYEIKVEATNTGNKKWGKVINVTEEGGNVVSGWINLAYTDVEETLGESGEAAGQTGKITNADEVNIRSTAGITTTNRITSLKRGTKVTVLETTMVGTAQWGLVKWGTPSDGYTQGWVYMHYVQLDSAPAGSTGSDNSNVLYTGVVTSNINLNVRKSADIYAAKVGSLPNGSKINVYEVTTSRNMKWGRIGEDRWVCLSYVNLTQVAQPETGSGNTTSTTTTQATVTAATLDVLQNYNSNAAKVGTLKKGDVVTILEKNTEETTTGSRIWGRISHMGTSGWINLAYVDLKTVTSVNGTTGGSSAGTSNANGANAVIANCLSVNIREAAGVYNAQITKLNNGTAVQVYEKVTKDNAPWARITWNNGANEGWVCMYYVEMASGSAGTTEGGLIGGTNSNTISATGVVNSNIDLNVRSGAGLGYGKIGALSKGTRVTVYEQATADGMIWGRINYSNGSGWICMSYISVESTSTTGKGVMGTIARCFAAVNVRSAPGTGNALVNKINVGTRVEVFETKDYNGQLWGRVAQGWICMDYVLLDSELPPGTILDATEPSTEATTPEVPEETINRDNEVLYTISGKVIANPLNVRNDADADSHKVGTVKQDEVIKILALKNNGAELWGRIDQYATAGWVNMAYVNYSVVGFVNTDEQPVFANPDTTSAVKANLNINTPLTITKLTVNGETVYGWVDSANGWIPMGRISSTESEVIPVYRSSTDSFGTNKTQGTTMTAVDAVNVVNGSKVVFKLQSGVTVYVGDIKIEARTVWGKLTANGVEGWIDMSKVNYTLDGTFSGEMNVRESKVITDDETEDSNVLGTISSSVKLCELSFDGDGNLWGKVTGNANSAVNGGYIMVTGHISY